MLSTTLDSLLELEHWLYMYGGAQDASSKPQLSAFGRWQQHWLPPLVDVFCRGDGSHTRGLHYCLLDVCMLLLRWSQSHDSALPPAAAADALMSHLVGSCCSPAHQHSTHNLLC